MRSYQEVSVRSITSFDGTSPNISAMGCWRTSAIRPRTRMMPLARCELAWPSLRNCAARNCPIRSTSALVSTPGWWSQVRWAAESIANTARSWARHPISPPGCRRGGSRHRGHQPRHLSPGGRPVRMRGPGAANGQGHLQPIVAVSGSAQSEAQSRFEVAVKPGRRRWSAVSTNWACCGSDGKTPGKVKARWCYSVGSRESASPGWCKRSGSRPWRRARQG